MKWKCKECDSEHLEQLAWCNVNTNRINDWQDSGTVYCCECNAEDSAIEVKVLNEAGDVEIKKRGRRNDSKVN